MLQQLAEEDCTISELKNSLPQYFIDKKKIELNNISPDTVINSMIEKYSKEVINTDDGLRIDFSDHWVHLRKSNTEPIIRIITEAKTEELAKEFSQKYFKEITGLF